MLIRTRFLLRLSGFLLVLTSGSAGLAAAEFLPFSLPEETTPSPSHDSPFSLELSVEPLGAEPGSVVEEPAQVVERWSWHPRIEADPWAEAFAESALVARVTSVAVPAGASIPLNQQVQYFLDRFTLERRWVVDRWFGRAGRYLKMIQDTLRNHGLPEDLAFVAMIESGFNPVAVSRAGAKGLWQFMAGTARAYGLRVDQWVDERFDPEKSTMAAAAYLRDLYAQFGSWSLAQAAYNAGEMTVIRAIRAVGSKDFWALARSTSLAQETKEFVPQIQAATVIGQDPSRYGFDVRGHSANDVELVSIPPRTNLTAVARVSGVSKETLRSLNPVLVKGVTPPGAPYSLRVPAGTTGAIYAALTTRRSPAERSSVRADVHVVRAGDTVNAIAKRHGVGVNDLRRWNNLAGDLIRPGDRLIVAASPVTASREGQLRNR
jgi:membrane-bound lytic murein transglycosylase D